MELTVLLIILVSSAVISMIYSCRVTADELYVVHVLNEKGTPYSKSDKISLYGECLLSCIQIIFSIVSVIDIFRMFFLSYYSSVDSQQFILPTILFVIVLVLTLIRRKYKISNDIVQSIRRHCFISDLICAILSVVVCVLLNITSIEVLEGNLYNYQLNKLGTAEIYYSTDSLISSRDDIQLIREDNKFYFLNDVDKVRYKRVLWLYDNKEYIPKESINGEELNSDLVTVRFVYKDDTVKDYNIKDVTLTQLSDDSVYCVVNDGYSSLNHYFEVK